MSLSPDFDIRERVRSANDIIDVVGSTIELRRQGAAWVARCPWHDDNKPSLSVNQIRQSWKCWPCDIGGDVFSFVMKRDGVSFPEALKILADRAGIEIEQTGKKVEKGSAEDKATLLEAMKWAENQFFRYLAESPDAAVVRDYLKERGINEESREKFRIGFAPDQWEWLVGGGVEPNKSFSPPILEACGLAKVRPNGSGHFDFFRARLMFPIYDLQDRPIAFGGRHVPSVGDQSGGKYMNTSDTRLFSKHQHLYALNSARYAMKKNPVAMVMEGYTDVIAAQQHGIDTAVACLGVAVGESHIKLLQRFADRIVLVLDGDAAGQARTDEILSLFVSSDVDMRVLSLPEGQDPADYLNAHGAEAFNRLVEQAPDAIEHKLARVTEGVDLTKDTHAASSAIESILDLLSKSPQQSETLRADQILMRLSRTFRLPSDSLKSRIVQLRQRSRAQPYTSKPKSEQVELPREPIAGLDREMFELMIESPSLAPQAIEAIHPNWLSNDTARRLMHLYEEMEFEGLELKLETVLLGVEDVYLKSLLVDFQQSVDEKAEHVKSPVGDRLLAVVERYREVEQSQEQKRQLAELETNELDDEEEIERLTQMFNMEKSRQGLLSRRDPDA